MDKFSIDIPEIFYDLIGIFFPGFFLYFCSTLILPKDTFAALLKQPFMNEIVAAIFLVYLSGHAIYSLSSVFVSRLFTVLSGNPRFTLLGKPLSSKQKFFNKHFLLEDINHDKYFMETVTKGIQTHTKINDFDLKKQENIDIAFEHCRNYVMEKTSRNYSIIRKEQAYGEMARGIIFVCFVCIVGILVINFYYSPVEHFWLVLAFLFLTLITFSFRYGQARHIDPIFIFSTFCTLISEKNGIEVERRIITKINYNEKEIFPERRAW